ncbi:Tat pathway signal protein [Phenylobacterium terrae]|uniref:Tat pathway signal protein n=1 Tax=Phenylobacterium terrae TaxID=2665495 RepID=A0ABW4N0E7_9CAUL
MQRRSVLLAAAAAAAVPAAARAASSREKKAVGGLSFVALPAVTSTVRTPNGRRGVLMVELGLDIPDSRLRERAEASQPRLRAAFAQLLQTYATGLPPGAPPNADTLSREMQRETDRVLGRAGARLLLGTVMVN